MRVAVIGGGAAGLACALAMDREGLEPVVFERRGELGGVWSPGPPTDPHAPPMYDGLRTNLPASVMAFRDLPFEPSGTSAFVHHSEVRAYLDAYARAFTLHRFVRLRSAVESVEPRDEGWEVRSAGQTERFDAVAVCNGHYAAPRWPELDGAHATRIRVSHSRTYRTPADFAGQRVALLGAKASGTDIAIELQGVAAQVVLCAREFDTTVAATEAWPVERRPSIAAFAGERGVVLADGSTLEGLDALIYCTGYRYAFDFLPGGLVDTADGSVGPLHLDVLSTRAPTLGFIGLPAVVVPFPLFEAQSLWLARVWSGALSRPTTAAIAQERDADARRRSAKGLAAHQQLRYGEGGFDQLDRFAELCGTAPYPEALRDAYAQAGAARRARPASYRDA